MKPGTRFMTEVVVINHDSWGLLPIGPDCGWVWVVPARFENTHLTHQMAFPVYARDITPIPEPKETPNG